MLLSKEFVVLVLISLLIAFPVAWWAMSKWLQHFVYPPTSAGGYLWPLQVLRFCFVCYGKPPNSKYGFSQPRT